MAKAHEVMLAGALALILAAPKEAAALSPLPQQTDSRNSSAQQSKPDPETERLKELDALQRAMTAAQNVDPNIERDNLFAILKTAETEDGARFVAQKIWNSWLDAAPDAGIRKLMDDALERRRWHDYEGARVILDRVVEAAPAYAEGWNQRAFIFFLQEKYDESLVDIEKALALEPRHFGALSGKARILTNRNEHKDAQAALKLAVDVYPWIFERKLLRPEE